MTVSLDKVVNDSSTFAFQEGEPNIFIRSLAPSSNSMVTSGDFASELGMSPESSAYIRGMLLYGHVDTIPSTSQVFVQLRAFTNVVNDMMAKKNAIAKAYDVIHELCDVAFEDDREDTVELSMENVNKILKALNLPEYKTTRNYTVSATVTYEVSVEVEDCADEDEADEKAREILENEGTDPFWNASDGEVHSISQYDVSIDSIEEA